MTQWADWDVAPESGARLEAERTRETQTRPTMMTTRDEDKKPPHNHVKTAHICYNVTDKL